MPAEKKDWQLTGRVMGALIEVHRRLGPGLLESAYEACVVEELRHRKIRFRQQVPVPIEYRTIVFPRAFVADLVIDDCLLVELKAVENITAVDIARTLTYVRLLRIETALLVNFHVIELRRGIRRVTRPRQEPRETGSAALRAAEEEARET